MSTSLTVAGLVTAAALAAPAGAMPVLPTSYDMLNGDIGVFAYLDDTYNGKGNPFKAGAPLSGGVGKLTDGVFGTANWDVDPASYVGWRFRESAITFRFEEPVQFTSLRIGVDDSNFAGGVTPPLSVDVDIAGVVHSFLIDDPASGAPLVLDLPVFGAGDAVVVTFAPRTEWFMVSEVQFFAVPAPGAAAVLALAGLASSRRQR